MPASVGFWGGIGCMLGRHVRSRGQARATPEGWVTRCARCAIPMARAHGGGKWLVVKTPMTSKTSAGEKAEKAFAKTIVRSRKAAKRNDPRAAEPGIAPTLTDVAGDTIESDREVEPRRRRFRRKRAEKQAGVKRGRRFLFFRRKARPETDDEPLPLTTDTEGSTKKRRVLRRRKKDAPTEGES